MKTDLFQSCGPCWVFQICWHIEGSTFTASSFRIWKSSTGIPSPPLALFLVMLPKGHLTSHFRMSSSRWVWVITPSWLSGLWRSFLYSYSVYSCHFFLISSASVKSIPFLSFMPFPYPRDLPDPGTESRSPALQAESLPSESPGKPTNLYMMVTESSYTKVLWNLLECFFKI